MKASLIALNVITWPFLFVMWAVGTGAWHLYMSLTGIIIFSVILLLVPNIPFKIKMYILGLLSLSMALSHIPYISYIYAVVIPLLAIIYILLFHISINHEKVLRYLYYSVTVPYIFLGFIAFYVNELTLYLYSTFILEQPVSPLPEVYNYSYIDAMKTSLIFLSFSLPSICSVAFLFFYNQNKPNKANPHG